MQKKFMKSWLAMSQFKNTISVDSILSWTGTFAIIAATCVRALLVSETNILDLTLTGIGCLLWAVCAYRTKNKPLFLVNAFSVFIVVVGYCFILVKSLY
jgi:hypothetical protein